PPTYTLSLHDALPIWHHRDDRTRRSRAIRRQFTHLPSQVPHAGRPGLEGERRRDQAADPERVAADVSALPPNRRHRFQIVARPLDRKSTRLNSSHVKI